MRNWVVSLTFQHGTVTPQSVKADSAIAAIKKAKKHARETNQKLGTLDAVTAMEKK